MKKNLLFILVLWRWNAVYAQTSPYIPFTDNMIVYGASQYDDLSGLQPPVFFRTEIIGDTIIGGFHYAKMYAGTASYVFEGGIRNDTLNRKVYKYYPSLGTEKLLYDFNLAVGDTVNSTVGYGFYAPLINVPTPFSYPTIGTTWVVSIDSILLPHDGLYHRRFNFKGKIIDLDSFFISESSSILYDSMGFTRTIFMKSLIEGVGQMNNPIGAYSSSHMGNPFQWWSGVLCSSINGVPLVNYTVSFGDPALCNSISAAVNEIKESENIIFFPNPSTGKFQLTLSNLKESTIEISDVLGNLILKSEIKNQTTELNLSDHKSGIYFVRMYDSEGDFVVKKIVKQ